MKNDGGTEANSDELEVLFVAGPLLRDLLHCNSRSSGARQAAWTAPSPRRRKTCAPRALHAEIRSPSAIDLVHVTNQINAATDHQHSRHGPQNEDWHLSSSSV